MRVKLYHYVIEADGITLTLDCEYDFNGYRKMFFPV